MGYIYNIHDISNKITDTVSYFKVSDEFSDDKIIAEYFNNSVIFNKGFVIENPEIVKKIVIKLIERNCDEQCSIPSILINRDTILAIKNNPKIKSIRAEDLVLSPKGYELLYSKGHRDLWIKGMPGVISEKRTIEEQNKFQIFFQYEYYDFLDDINYNHSYKRIDIKDINEKVRVIDKKSLVFGKELLQDFVKLQNFIKKVVENSKYDGFHIDNNELITNDVVSEILKNKNIKRLHLNDFVLTNEIYEKIKDSSLELIAAKEISYELFQKIINSNINLGCESVNFSLEQFNNYDKSNINSIRLSDINDMVKVHIGYFRHNYNGGDPFSGKYINKEKSLNSESFIEFSKELLNFPLELKDQVLKIVRDTKCESFTIANNELIDKDVILEIVKNQNIHYLKISNTKLSNEFFQMLLDSHIMNIEIDDFVPGTYVSNYFNPKVKCTKLHNLCGNDMYNFTNVLVIKDEYSEMEIRQLVAFCGKKEDIVFGFKIKSQLELYLKYFSQAKIKFDIKQNEMSDFSYEELKIIKQYSELNEEPILFKLDYEVLPIDRICEAKLIIQGIAKEINDSDFRLTPFEKYCYAYEIVKRFKEYKKEGKNEPSEVSRRVEHILFNDKIVCGGYSEFLYEIVKALDDPNLAISTYNCSESGNEIDHTRNVIGIRDDKYDINGVFTSDVTFDSIKYDKIEIDTVSYLLRGDIQDKDLIELKQLLNGYSNNNDLIQVNHFAESVNSFKKYLGFNSKYIPTQLSMKVTGKIQKEIITYTSTEIEDVHEKSDLKHRL